MFKWKKKPKLIRKNQNIQYFQEVLCKTTKKAFSALSNEFLEMIIQNLHKDNNAESSHLEVFFLKAVCFFLKNAIFVALKIN